MSTQDGAVVDPWVVLRRLMAENRALRQERDELLARVDHLELQLLAEPSPEVAAGKSRPVLRGLATADDSTGGLAPVQ
jgi:hypothetical protein